MSPNTKERDELPKGISTKDVKYIVYHGDEYYPAAYAFTNYGAAKKHWDELKADQTRSDYRCADYLAKVIEFDGEDDMIDEQEL